ncbi:hypothetical protein BGZ76_003844 [Entomortierella beljakovae]|nr:hypothetical protein BGZ76_003844 [Entomortierella beljakovae]
MLLSTQNTSSTSTPYVDVPVLISGAGPSGIYAAILLTKLNIPCRIIERYHDISPLSKALVIHSRTLEIFAISGILDKFLERGDALSEFHAYNGSKLAGAFPALKNTESHYDFGLFLEQFRTTAILSEEFEALGQKIDRGWELMDTKVVEDTGKSFVETTIRRAIDGTNIRKTESKVLGVVEEDPEEKGKKYEIQVVRSEYLIASDGGKSVVRHKLNIPFPGRTLDNNIIIYDGHVESEIPFKNVTAINGVNNRLMAAFPMQDGIVRIILDQGVITPEEHASLKSEDLTVEEFERLASACIAPAKLKCLDCSWLTYYRVNERQAEHFGYKNRIFLAGDAAHVHSPAGGQGMNTGLQDSFNLTWKLALVMHGIAPQSLLETYESERKPVADGIIKLTAKILEVGLAHDIFTRTMRRIVFTIAPYIFPYVPTPRANPVTMLTIGYTDNSLNQRSKSQGSIGDEFQVGRRARDGSLQEIPKHDTEPAFSENSSVRLHELISGPGIFHIIVFTSDMLLTTSSPKKSIKGVEVTTSEELATNTETYLNGWRSKWAYKTFKKMATSSAFADPNLIVVPENGTSDKLFMVHTLASDLSVPPSNYPSGLKNNDALCVKNIGDGKLYLDHAGVVHEKYGVAAKYGPGAIVVVRPDSYIGYRVLGANKTSWDEIDQYFTSILTN